MTTVDIWELIGEKKLTNKAIKPIKKYPAKNLKKKSL